MNRIKKGDQVVVRAGQDKGRRGVIQEMILDSNGKPARVVVEGVNMKTHYDRPNPEKNQPGGLVKREAPLHASNVALVDPDSGRAARVRMKTGDNGKKVRVFASSGKEVGS